MSVPTPVTIPAKLAYLTGPEGAALLARAMADARDDLALASADWMRALPAAARTAVLEQRALRLRGLRKHPRAAEMLFTPMGLQQMTADAVARYKAARLPEGVHALADLCCGPGGDSLHLPPDVRVVGVDRDAEALRAYRHNVSLFRGAAATLAVQANVTCFAARVDGVLLDPARRALAPRGGARDFDEEPEPGWDAITAISTRFGGAILKLGPGARLPEALEEQEREYIGLHDECLELSVRTGRFGRPGMVRAVELPSGAAVEARAADLPDTFGRVEEPGAWFYEPVKSVVRAHLFGVLAGDHGLWQLDARTAYLSGDARVQTPLLKRYRVLRVLPVDERALREEIGRAEIGNLEIKKRGMDIVPETWRRKLRPRGPAAGTLVFTRLQGRPAVLRVERDADGPGDDPSGEA